MAKIEVTNMIAGPFSLIVQGLEGALFVVAPDGGFKTKEAALEVAKQWEGEKDSSHITFSIQGLRDPASLKHFMSW